MKIDFVILWVDGNDEKWLEEKNIYSNATTSNTANRFREWDNLKYWFRGVEENASWVNKIFFITYGHIPEWLDVNNKKLRIVKHEEYIPKEFLPTYNSNTIELFLNKIKDLSENFVIFNDDVFITKKVEQKDFFIGNKTRDLCIFDSIVPSGKNDKFTFCLVNNIDIINKYFNKKELIRRNIFKVFNFRYGLLNIKNICLLVWKKHTGFHNHHVTVPQKKSTFDKIWKLEEERLLNSAKNRFRDYSDCSHWLMRYWNICEGSFIPRSRNFGKYFELDNNNDSIKNAIIKRKYKVICINDVKENIDFEFVKKDINSAFNDILPNKSRYEK